MAAGAESTLPLLAAAPEIIPRSETVDVPELGGAVIVRGLLASEVFALSGVRGQALRRVREARAEHEARIAALPEGAAQPEFEPPELDWDELRSYGAYITRLLACAVTLKNGLSLYSADQWEVVGQHHPGLPTRLQRIAERLSGLDAEDVQKNSQSSPN
jgi:hypothetical protein